MFSVDLSTRDGDGHVIVELRGLKFSDSGGVIDVFPDHARVDEATGHARRRAATLAARPIPAGRPALAVAT